ncbi:MAG: hypothetical protein ACKV2T_02575 [Kofleriaceae bacterium]
MAARLVELQREQQASFALDCDLPLITNVGRRSASAPLCQAGVSANQCADALFFDPPAISTLEPGNCASCMRGKWLPRCRDGSEACAPADEARCVDGTRGQIYVRPGAPSSRNWVIYLTPGGSTFAGAAAWVAYRYFPELDQADTAKTLSNLHPDAPTAASVSATGILRDGAPLGDFHRVMVNRCSELSSDTIERAPVTDGVPAENLAAMAADAPPDLLARLPTETRRSTVDAFHRGRNLWDAMFHQLTTEEGRDVDGDGDADIAQSFADADVVWIIGGSDAAHWVLLGADLMADMIHQVAPQARVRVGLDSFLHGGLDNEGRYVAGTASDFNVYDNPFSETQACGPLTLFDPYTQTDATNVVCSAANYSAGNAPSPFRDQFQRATMELRGFLVDESCAAYHQADVSPCYDGAHVLLHHLSTPHLLIGDRFDPKNRSGSVVYASDGRLAWRGSSTDYGVRVLDLMRDIEAHVQSGRGTREEGALPQGSTSIVLRNGGTQAAHVFTGSDRIDLRMTSCTGTTAGSSVSIGDAFARFGMLADPFMIEDPNDPSGSYWDTGNGCQGSPQ